MDKQNKGLVDDHDGDIILNESGTSVSFGWDTKESDANNEANSLHDDKRNNKEEPSGTTNDELALKE